MESITAQFIDDRLSGLLLMMRITQFDSIADGLKQKFGLPTSTETPAIQNRMGAVFVNTIITWQRGNTSVMATRYAGTVEMSSVYYADRTGAQKADQRRQDAAKERAKMM